MNARVGGWYVQWRYSYAYAIILCAHICWLPRARFAFSLSRQFTTDSDFYPINPPQHVHPPAPAGCPGRRPPCSAPGSSAPHLCVCVCVCVCYEEEHDIRVSVALRQRGIVLCVGLRRGGMCTRINVSSHVSRCIHSSRLTRRQLHFQCHLRRHGSLLCVKFRSRAYVRMWGGVHMSQPATHAPTPRVT
jgi:hypothetical protein